MAVICDVSRHIALIMLCFFFVVVQTPSLLLAYLVVSGMLLTYLRRPVGRMTITEQKLEGEFRFINSRLISNSEEVAFYNGNYREKLILIASFEKLVSFEAGRRRMLCTLKLFA